MSYFQNSRTVTARKRYRCEACGILITAGMKNVVIVNNFDGNFSSVRLHQSCDEWFYEILGWMDPRDAENGLCYQDVQDELVLAGMLEYIH